MKTRFLLAALVLAAGALPAKEDPPGLALDAYHRTVFFAVLEGLYQDGVSSEDVDLVLREDPATGLAMHFVPGCPLCNPALDAFRVYRARPAFVSVKADADTFGCGLGERLRAALRSGEMAERLGAVQELIERWLRARLDAMRLTPAERSAYRNAIEDRSKKGMALLLERQGSGTAGAFAAAKGCAVCDGSAGACR